MGNALGNILPQATGEAISPVPIITVILMLLSQRARSNGSADRFTAGKAFGLSALLAGVNPKNLALMLAAALSLAQASLSGAQSWIV
jgi:hypothetical protein